MERRYVPTPDEIIERGDTVRWLRDLGFSEQFMTEVMVKDIVSIDLIRRLVNKGHNTIEIERFCKNGN